MTKIIGFSLIIFLITIGTSNSSTVQQPTTLHHNQQISKFARSHIDRTERQIELQLNKIAQLDRKESQSKKLKKPDFKVLANKKKLELEKVTSLIKSYELQIKGLETFDHKNQQMTRKTDQKVIKNKLANATKYSQIIEHYKTNS